MGSWENSMIALGSYHHMGHILLVIIYCVLEYVLPPGPKKKAAGSVADTKDSKKEK